MEKEQQINFEILSKAKSKAKALTKDCENPFIAVSLSEEKLNGKQQHELAYILLCQCLKEKYNINETPQSLKLEQGEHGKPFLLDYPDIHFNLSHCAFGVAAAVFDSPVGIDIEKTKKFSERVVKRVMNQSEIQLIENSDNPEEMFFTLWTMKESFVKYNGKGISYGMKNIEVIPKENICNISDVKFMRYTVKDNFIISCCIGNRSTD